MLIVSSKSSNLFFCNLNIEDIVKHKELVKKVQNKLELQMPPGS